MSNTFTWLAPYRSLAEARAEGVWDLNKVIFGDENNHGLFSEISCTARALEDISVFMADGVDFEMSLGDEVYSSDQLLDKKRLRNVKKVSREIERHFTKESLYRDITHLPENASLDELFWYIESFRKETRFGVRWLGRIKKKVFSKLFC